MFAGLITTHMQPWLLPNLLTWLIVSPLVAAVLCMATPQRSVKPFAVILSLLPLALSVVAFRHFNMEASGLQFTESHQWLPALGATYLLGVDGLALPLIALNALLTPLCLLASWKVEKNPRAFLASLLALQGFVNGVFVAQDFVLFYVFWEAMLIPMFLLIGIWGGENRVYAALKFFLYTFLGSVLMLIAGLWLYSKTGTFALSAWYGLNLPLSVQCLLFLAFFAAFAVKIPMWPFHTWLPDAHVQAPTAGSVILAGVLLKMGAYGFLRFSLPMFPLASVHFGPYIFALSAIAVVYAALVAYVQTDVKKMIAYSSVSHMGMVTLGLFAGTVTGLHGGLLVMLNHGIVSAGLFLAVGVVYDRLHTRDLAKFGGLVRLMPAYAFVVMVLTLAAVALPGTNSFVGEFLALAGSWPIAPLATGIATTGVIFGALYMLHLYRGMFYGEPSKFVESHKADLPDLSAREWIIFLPLLILIPLLGIMPSLAMRVWEQPVQHLAVTMSAARQYLAAAPSLARLPEEHPTFPAAEGTVPETLISPSAIAIQAGQGAAVTTTLLATPTAVTQSAAPSPTQPAPTH